MSPANSTKFFSTIMPLWSEENITEGLRLGEAEKGARQRSDPRHQELLQIRTGEPSGRVVTNTVGRIEYLVFGFQGTNSRDVPVDHMTCSKPAKND